MRAATQANEAAVESVLSLSVSTNTNFVKW